MGVYGRGNNCMAYALGRKNWMLPLGWRALKNKPIERIEEHMATMLGKTFNLKMVSREDMVLGKEYIAFRIAYDGYEDADDFHFMKRHVSGHWTHKMGSQPVKGISEKVVFSDMWKFGTIYNGRIYLFEV
jgi:hypothetical protein